jgi:hypothetical protein
MSNLISTSSIASGSIIFPEHVLRSIQALRGETDTLFILSGSLVVSASDVRYPNLLENPTPTAFIAFNTSSGNFYWTTNQSSTSPSAYVSTGSVSGNTLTFTKGDNTTFDLIVSATGSSADSLTTASISGTTLTFTKGDNSTFNLTIASSSYALNADLLDGLNSTSFVLNSQTSSMTVLSASFASNASSSLRAVSSSYAVTASYALNAGGSGGTSFYQITLNMSGGIIDIGGTPIASVLGPNGENKATLEGLGWSFSTPTSTRLTVGRPASSQVQPLINIMTHGNNSGNVFSKAPTGQSTGAFSAVQTLATGAYTTFDLYSISNTNTGCASSGPTTVIVTFGLIS